MIMLIVDAKQTVQPPWGDPLVDVHTDQFRDSYSRLERLQPDVRPEEFAEAQNFASFLCDASRQIIYRLNRATPDQVEELIRCFRRAAESIQKWKLAKFDAQEAELVQNYAKHIEDRAQRLEARLRASK